MSKDFALVLGGGGAFGFAHLGVLKFLEQNSISPKIITGTSMGALIGALYAMGKSVDDILNMLDDFNNFKILDFKLMPFLSQSILRSDKINNYLKNLFGDINIEDLKVKFGCIGVNINKGEMFEFTKGKLWKAVRSSISVPAIFEPFKIKDKKFIDGGVMDNLPTELAFKFGAKKIIAVNVVDYDTALIEKKSLIATLINTITLCQKEILKLKSKYDLLVQLHLKDVSMINFCKDNANEAFIQGYEETKRDYGNNIINLLN